MATNWWKYGLCIFGGLGIGYAVGVKITKDRAEAEKEEEIVRIRELFRSDVRKSKPVKKESGPVLEKPETEAKTSIQMEKLSEKRDRADQANRKYSSAFDEKKKPGIEEEDISSENEKSKADWRDYIHLVKEFPEDSINKEIVLNYYADGVVTESVNDKRWTDQEIEERIGEENLKLLDEDGCNEIYIVNDLYRVNYTIIFRYQEWSAVVEEEPYKAEL